MEESSSYDFSRHLYRMEGWLLLADVMLVMGMTLLGLLIVFTLRSRKLLAQRLLAVVFGACFFFLLYYYAFLHRLGSVAGVAIIFGNGMGFLTGPVLFFYVKAVVMPKRLYARSIWLHLIPYFTYWLLVSVPVGVSLLAKPLFENWSAWYATYSNELNVVENLYLLSYLLLAILSIGRLGPLIRDAFSTLDNNDLQWCKQLLVGLSAIIVLDTLLAIYEIFSPVDSWNVGLIIAFSLIVLFAWLGYKGLFQARIFVPEFMLDPSAAIPPEASPNEAQQAAPVQVLASRSEDELEELKVRLFEVLETEKPYLNDSLTLSDLADLIPISSRQLSTLLNQHVQQSFYDLINDYRVATVKEKIQSPEADQLTLLALAYDSGFKSKTSFNRIFRQKTGVSPSEYRKQFTGSSSA